jgi:hypothetical protein
MLRSAEARQQNRLLPSRQLGSNVRLDSDGPVLRGGRDEESDEDNSYINPMPITYVNDLSRQFEDLGELAVDDSSLPAERVGEVDEEEVDRWVAREGRELDFVQGRKHEQLIVDGMWMLM